MNKLGRKLLVASLCACMAAASLTGCGSKAGKAAVTVGDDTASLGLVNLMLRYNQAQMQSLYASFMGDNMWETYGETTKSNIVESLENMFLMEQHMSDYGVSITDDASLRKAADVLLDTGLHRVFISLGADGVFAADRAGHQVQLPPLPGTMVNTTGCGDAFMAAITWAYLQGTDLTDTAKAGLAASVIAMESAETINPAMSEDTLRQRAALSN